MWTAIRSQPATGKPHALVERHAQSAVRLHAGTALTDTPDEKIYRFFTMTKVGVRHDAVVF